MLLAIYAYEYETLLITQPEFIAIWLKIEFNIHIPEFNK